MAEAYLEGHVDHVSRLAVVGRVQEVPFVRHRWHCSGRSGSWSGCRRTRSRRVGAGRCRGGRSSGRSRSRSRSCRRGCCVGLTFESLVNKVATGCSPSRQRLTNWTSIGRYSGLEGQELIQSEKVGYSTLDSHSASRRLCWQQAYRQLDGQENCQTSLRFNQPSSKRT